MNKNGTAVRRILPLTLASLGALGGNLQPAAADILLSTVGTRPPFSTDGYFNASRQQRRRPPGGATSPPVAGEDGIPAGTGRLQLRPGRSTS